jgi:glycosyltransferase involved in cell wall biosynthesis
MKKIGLIIPCFNEEEMINKLYSETEKVISKIPSFEFFYIFIDDGSSDQTLSLIKEKAQSNNRVKYISFSKNFGKESAMLAGLKASLKLNVDASIFMDADLQDPPYLIIEFLGYFTQGYNYVVARNINRKGQAFFKRFFSNLYYVIFAFLTANKNSISGSRDFALLSKNVIHAFLKYKDQKRFSKGIAAQIGFNRKIIDYEYNNRHAGASKWSFKKLYQYALVGIEQFSRVYILIPNLMLTFLVIVIIGLIFLAFQYGFDAIIIYLLFSVLTLFMTIFAKILIKLQYDLRDQLTQRPEFLAQESNIELE